MKKMLIKIFIVLNVGVFSLLFIHSVFASERLENDCDYNCVDEIEVNKAEQLPEEAAEMGMVPLDNTGIWVIPDSTPPISADEQSEDNMPEQNLTHKVFIGDRQNIARVTSAPVVISAPTTPPPVVNFTPEFQNRVKSEGLKEIPGSGIWVNP